MVSSIDHPRVPAARRLPDRDRVPPSPHPRGLGPALDPSINNLDRELHTLSRGAGRLRLRIGQALHRLGRGIHELGFSTLGAYALERCNRGGRWAADTRTLARRLEALPLLTGALESGAIGWSMAELLARHATPQTEAALLQVARGKTVHAMRIALNPPESATNPHTHLDPNLDPDLDQDDLARTLSLTLQLEEAWALEATRMVVEHMDGTCTAAEFLQALLAEATVPLLELTAPAAPDTANAPDVTTQMEAELLAWRTEMHRLQHQQAQAELRARPEVPTNFNPEPHPGQAPAADDLPTTLEALDARLRHYSAELASRDLFFGRIARRFLALHGWQTLGFASEAHYARERLGMSRASLRSKISLARRTEHLPLIIDALQRGHIGFEAAHLISRIATPTTERAWLTRATRRTFKHLREEVQAVELTTRFTPQTDTSPPTAAHVEQVQSVERAILTGELLRRVISTDNADTAVQISAAPNRKVTLRIRAPGDLLLHYRQLERLHRHEFPGESFIAFLCTVFWQTWVPHLGHSDKWEQVYRRDRYRCTSPVCHQRNITLHHVKYRAHGGTDADENLTTPCAFCHLEGEHGGRLQILPPGNNPTWLLGRTPIMRVQARERTLLN